MAPNLRQRPARGLASIVAASASPREEEHRGYGSSLGRYQSDRRAMAVRTEMGWLSLPPGAQRRYGRALLEVGTEAQSLLSGACRRRSIDPGKKLRPRR